MSKQGFFNMVVLVALMVAIGSIWFLYEGKQKIGYVSNQEILESYRGFIEAREIYEVQVLEWKSQLDSLEVSVDKSVASYRNNFAKLTPKERQINEQIIQAQKNEYYQYKESMEQKASDKDNQMVKGLLVQIDAYIHAYGEENQFTYILGTADNGNILYAQETEDITAVILEGLNKEYEGVHE